uniref:Zinc finger MYM-type protein 1 n=1 Tax=Sipha flava TaxID=143950 RepID=A0A2S2R9U9_9HEMI
MSLVEEVCVCGKMKAKMNSTNWLRHTIACKKRKSVESTAKLSTFFKSSRNVSDKVETLVIETIDSIVCEQRKSDSQNYSESIPDDDVIDSNLVNENLDKLCTTCVVSKDIIEVSSVSSTTENISGSNVESYLNTISTIFESYPNDPALIPTSNISDEQFSFINSLGPCQPLQSSLPGKQFLKRMQGERLRSFHDEHYFKKLQYGSLVKRMWMSYSPSVDKVYCIACKLFGTSTAKKNPLAKDGINDWKHISRRILCHETSSDHLQAVLRKSMYNSNQRVDVGLILESSNAYVAENREVVKIIFETIIYLARQNIPFRGHDESLTSLNKGNFLEMLKLLSKHHALLSCHLRKIEDSKNHNRLTFLSNVSQNTMICILGELIHSKILKSVKSAQVFSIMIDTTTDISNLEQFSLVLRFVNDQGMVEERLVALKIATDSTGKGMFNLFCDICEKYGLDWKNQLCAQSYDGAAVMQGQ